MKRDNLLDLNEALQHPGTKVSVDISTDLLDEGDLDLIGSVEGYLEAVSTGNLLLVTGEFKTRAVVECARCTSPIETDLVFEIEEQFPVEGIPSAYSSSDYSKVVPDEEYPLFDGNSLMVDALLRQTVLLAIPIQPLCEAGWENPCPIAEGLGVKLPIANENHLLSGLGQIMHQRETKKGTGRLK